MARIDDLVKEIGDERVRREIAAEVKKLREEKKFGLVFENHLPELSYLHTASVRAGANVVKRGAKAAEVYRVVGVEDGAARLVRDVEGASETERVAMSELTVVKRYGEAIYPALLPVESVTKNPAKPYHSIINADNYHALQLLLYCYEGKFDVIYIDPPYNTGESDWKYNNDYVDKSDAWRHSKWLSMISKRLRLAKRLLKEVGTIIVAIDDVEYSHLALVMDSIFDGWSKHTIVTLVNARGKGGANFSRVHEYLLVYVAPTGAVLPLPKKLNEPLFEDIESSDEQLDEDAQTNTFLAPLRRWGQGSSRKDRASMFFPIYVNKETLTIVDVGTPMPLEAKPEPFDKDGVVAVYPIDKKGIQRRWRYGYEGVLDEIDANNLVVVSDGDKFEIKRRETPTDYVAWKTLWTKEEFAGSSGARFLKYIFGRDDAFDYPKSVYAVIEAIFAATHNRPNALILDFFAGSGTTLQSTCFLNATYGGNRRCVLVTNNEVDERTTKQLNRAGIFAGDSEFERHGICEAVTFPRCKYVINGQRDDGTPLPGKYLNGRELATGFDENLAYFKLDFLDPNEVALGSKFENVLPILWLMAGAQGQLVIRNGKKPFYIPDASPFAVLLKERHFSEFQTALASRPDITHVFLVTDSQEAFREMSANIGGGRETFMLYKNYLDNFRLNTERTNA